MSISWVAQVGGADACRCLAVPGGADRPPGADGPRIGRVDMDGGDGPVALAGSGLPPVDVLEELAGPVDVFAQRAAVLVAAVARARRRDVTASTNRRPRSRWRSTSACPWGRGSIHE